MTAPGGSPPTAVPPIVTVDWLRTVSERAGDVVLCDVRTTMTGADPHGDYLAGHLPGARFIDLDAVLADPPDGVRGRHPLPTPERFAAELGARGIASGTTVVAYDTRGGAFAGRLVWMLRIIGEPAALLDGGLAAWDGPLETGVVEATPVDRTAVPWPRHRLADADDVAAHIAAGGVVVDSRDGPRYRGEVEPIDPVAGHVPGAINLPFADNLADGRFRTPAELAARLAPLVDDARTVGSESDPTVGSDSDSIVYCGSGVTACHNALAAEHAGLGLPRVYVGSWSGWSADPARPIATTPSPPTP